MAIDPVPDDPAASPVDGYWFDENTQWYRPDFLETAKLLGWRWIYWIPVLLILLLVVFFPYIGLRLLINGWKLVIFAVAIPLVAFAEAARKAIRQRKDPFCIHCGYSLETLPDNYRCPECGQPYLHRLIDEYRRDPKFFIERHENRGKLPPSSYAPFAAGKVRKLSGDGT